MGFHGKPFPKGMGLVETQVLYLPGFLMAHQENVKLAFSVWKSEKGGIGEERRKRTIAHDSSQSSDRPVSERHHIRVLREMLFLLGQADKAYIMYKGPCCVAGGKTAKTCTERCQNVWSYEVSWEMYIWDTKTIQAAFRQVAHSASFRSSA